MTLSKYDLRELMRRELEDFHFIVVSNREPYIHNYTADGIKCVIPAGGLTGALDPIMRACGGTWIAHGSGTADSRMVDEDNKLEVPPDAGEYTLRRVWLTKEQEEGYYSGFANEALWPLCHIAYTQPVFNEQHWNTYKEVNQVFAENVLNEVGDGQAIVFIQDYHLALLPRLLKDENPSIVTALFWHIPWPNHEVFRICPWQEEILNGLLGSDLLGFHLRYHCNNFMDTIERTIEARIDYEQFEVTSGGKKTVVRPFPISIDFEQICREAQTVEVNEEMERLVKTLGIGGQVIGLGLDRIDYTKGIPNRLKALDRFFARYPRYQGNMTFIQAGVQSRVHIEAYRQLNEGIDRQIEEINDRYGSGSWKPIIYLPEDLPSVSLMALNRLAHFCIVSPLHDGMNLVAKEFVASRFDEDGVLILSPFTGAARELNDALLSNPYATDHFAETIGRALDMGRRERRTRMRRMRQVVQENSIYKWAADVAMEMGKLNPWE